MSPATPVRATAFCTGSNCSGGVLARSTGTTRGAGLGGTLARAAERTFGVLALSCEIGFGCASAAELAGEGEAGPVGFDIEVAEDDAVPTAVSVGALLRRGGGEGRRVIEDGTPLPCCVREDGGTGVEAVTCGRTEGGTAFASGTTETACRAREEGGTGGIALGVSARDGVDVPGRGGVDVLGRDGVDVLGRDGVDVLGRDGVDVPGRGGVDAPGRGGLAVLADGGGGVNRAESPAKAFDRVVASLGIDLS